jgi:hypothetical protein
MLHLETTKPQVRNNLQMYACTTFALSSHLLLLHDIETGNHADFHQFVGSRPYVYYYHLWLVDIPHLSYLAVPKLSAAVFQISTTMTDQGNDEQDDADSKISNGSSVADDNLSTISPPIVVQQRRGVSTSSSSMTS